MAQEQAAPRSPLVSFDEYVAKAMADWQVPGLAMAIVKDDQVVHEAGYGTLKAGEEQPVTAKTLFPIASCTKSITAAAIGLLVEEEKLGWNDHVRKHLPGFELYDPFVTREAALVDLIAHRTGLQPADKLWSKNEFAPDEIVRRMRFLQPKYSFRSRFSYNNLAYLVAGQVVERVSGRSWGDFVQERLLQPAGMRSTTTTFPAASGFAWPHADIAGKVQPLELERAYNESVAPAGAMWSNASDMARWLRLNLGGGEIEGRRVLSTAALRQMHSPQIVMPAHDNGAVYPKPNFRSYGLGWFVDDFRGKKLVWHSGAHNGFVAWVAMLPEEKLGFVILANVHQTGVNFALHHRILDAYLGQPEQDWSAIVKNDYAGGWQKALRETKAAYVNRRRAGMKPSLPLSDYAGAYESELYGRLVILHTPDGLELQFGPRHVAPLQHWHDDVFRTEFSNPMLEDWQLTFEIGDDGSARSLRAVAAPWAPAWYEDSCDLGEFVQASLFE